MHPRNKIERVYIVSTKVDILNDSIKCRASVPNYYSWFGGRVRIGHLNKLIIPEYLFFLVMLLLFLWGFSSKASNVNNF